MSLLKLTNFGGEVPRVKPRGLPDGAAQRYENLLANAVFERDPSKQQAVREQVSAWNQRNPSSPIKIDMQAVRRRVADMRRSKAERVQRSAPKAIRADVRQALMEGA